VRLATEYRAHQPLPSLTPSPPRVLFGDVRFELAAPLPEPSSVSAFKPRSVGFSLGPSDTAAPVDGEAAEAAGGADESGSSAKTPFSLVFALQTPGRNNLAAGITLHAVVPTSAPKLSELQAAAQNALR